MVMKTRSKKRMIVIAYDVSDDRRRSHVVKLLERVGIRVNFSVFECMLTDRQYDTLRKDILECISTKEDTVVYYPICLDCYAQIVYQPEKRKAYPVVRVVWQGLELQNNRLVKIFICENSKNIKVFIFNILSISLRFSCF